jgi:Glycosyl-hydrolase family 116, catalytic region
MTGVQHNTYDVEFYGPNPLCGIYYLGALRAAEEIARVLGHTDEARSYRDLFERGSRWIDNNLFNGEYYIQDVRPIPKNQIAPRTVGDMGSERSDQPEFQLGKGCLADQLIGQYQADLAGLGPLLDTAHMRSALASIYKYNYRPNLMHNDSVQRVYVLNDEPAVLVCDYGRGERPRIPFPYYQEAWTGIEYLVGSQMIFSGMAEEGVRCIENVRRRFDGERRNPWDEPECGHHYARAMSAWSGILAVSGFSYHGANRAVIARPRMGPTVFRSFWSTATGWGWFAYSGKATSEFELSVVEGTLQMRSLGLRKSVGTRLAAKTGDSPLEISTSEKPEGVEVVLPSEITVGPGKSLVIARGT